EWRFWLDGFDRRGGPSDDVGALLRELGHGVVRRGRAVRLAAAGLTLSGPDRPAPQAPPSFSAPAPGHPQFLPPSNYGAGPYQQVLNAPPAPNPYPGPDEPPRNLYMPHGR
ncbi:hypothetical protein HUX53_37810, partial [Actinomadura sp. BRA 177]|nr:hypothetical protein [Actinomadura sp. BRA 177]